MQDKLFETARNQLDLARDPYEHERVTAKRIATGYGISVDEAFDLLLGHGSEEAVRRALKQRWWRGELGQLDEEAA